MSGQDAQLERLREENFALAREVTRWREEQWKTADAAARWIAYEVVANEIRPGVPLPSVLRPHVARILAEDERLGYPDLADAHATLDDWRWSDDPAPPPRSDALEEAARLRREGEEARRNGVEALMRAVQEHRHLGATEISRRLTAAGWPIRRQQVHTLMRGRTR